MLDKVRRKSRRDGGVIRSSTDTGSGIVATERSTTRPDPDREEKVTFFTLPAEVRNVIYEAVATDTAIRIPSPKEKNGKQAPRIVSLLIVSRRTRVEFLPLLLRSAPIRAMVDDFDFRSLAATCRSLYSTELKALRNNERLTIELLAAKCSKPAFRSLQRWLEERARGLDRLPWTYSVVWKAHHQLLPTSTAVSMANAYTMRKNILHHNLAGLATLYQGVGEMVQFELLTVMDAFEAALLRLNS